MTGAASPEPLKQDKMELSSVTSGEIYDFIKAECRSGQASTNFFKTSFGVSSTVAPQKFDFDLPDV